LSILFIFSKKQFSVLLVLCTFLFLFINFGPYFPLFLLFLSFCLFLVLLVLVSLGVCDLVLGHWFSIRSLIFLSI
jgi:hypothetical protein